MYPHCKDHRRMAWQFDSSKVVGTIYGVLIQTLIRHINIARRFYLQYMYPKMNPSKDFIDVSHENRDVPRWH